MIAVGVNGYGTIGKRVADAVAAQPDMRVAGVAKTSPDHEAVAANRRGYALYAAIPERAEQFHDRGVALAGDIEQLVRASDVVVDATPAGIGAKNHARYRRAGTKAVFQGGEDAAIADASFNARGNYTPAIGADAVRVVSCNTTGLSRLLAPLEETYGVAKARVTLIRRGGDPDQADRGPINDVVPDPVTIPSHHGPDVNTILPEIDVDTLAVQVPTTLMHLHAVNVTLESRPDVSEVRDLLADESRLAFVPGEAGIEGTGALREFARDADRPRGDLWENCLWADSLTVEGRDLYVFQAIHQESNVVPENIDAIRAIAAGVDATSSMATTDEALGVGEGFGMSGSRSRARMVPDGGSGSGDHDERS